MQAELWDCVSLLLEELLVTALHGSSARVLFQGLRTAHFDVVYVCLKYLSNFPCSWQPLFVLSDWKQPCFRHSLILDARFCQLCCNVLGWWDQIFYSNIRFSRSKLWAYLHFIDHFDLALLKVKLAKPASQKNSLGLEEPKLNSKRRSYGGKSNSVPGKLSYFLLLSGLSFWRLKSWMVWFESPEHTILM